MHGHRNSALLAAKNKYNNLKTQVKQLNLLLKLLEYQKVQRSTEKYQEVLRSTKKYQEVPKSNEKY